MASTALHGLRACALALLGGASMAASAAGFTIGGHDFGSQAAFIAAGARCATPTPTDAEVAHVVQSTQRWLQQRQAQGREVAARPIGSVTVRARAWPTATARSRRSTRRSRC